MTTKVIRRQKPVIHPKGKVKRTGVVYFEAWYWSGLRWSYKEFDTRAKANEFLTQYN